MTGRDIVTGLRAEVIEPNPAFFTDATLLYWINRAQNKYVARTRCLQSFAFSSTVPGQRDYVMPANWLASEKIFWNNPQNGIPSWTPLTPTSLEKMSQESPNFLSDDPNMKGLPQKYFIQGKTLSIFPTTKLSGTDDLFMFFEAKPIQLLTLDDEISVDDSLADGIEAYVLWRMWKMDQEKELADEAYERFKFEVGQGLKWKKQKVLDGKWKIDIQSFIPYNYSSINGSAFNNQLNPLNL